MLASLVLAAALGGRVLGIDPVAQVGVRLTPAGSVEAVRLGSLKVLDRYDPPVCDRSPHIETARVTGRSTSEVVLQCGVGNPSQEWAWVLQWRNSKLNLLNRANEPYVNATLLDVDGNGTSEILVPHAGEYVQPSFTMYSYRADGLRSWTPVPFFGDFFGTSKIPKSVVKRFDAAPGRYDVFIRNGVITEPVADATVSVNGEVIAPRDAFSSLPATIRRRVKLRDENRLQVTVRAPSGAALLVVVVPVE